MSVVFTILTILTNRGLVGATNRAGKANKASGPGEECACFNCQYFSGSPNQKKTVGLRH